MLISPAEPIRLKKLGKVSSVPERYGCDFLIVNQGATTGIQRKEFPGDFCSSLADGRLYELVRKMRGLDRGLLVLEGYGSWLENGNLDDRYASLNRQAFHGLVFSLTWEWGIEIWQNGGMDETAGMLKDLELWAAKPEHKSLNVRPGPRKDSWGLEAPRDRAIHVLQSFGGIGPELAGRIYDHFERLPLAWDINMSQLQEVPGVGPKKAAGIAKVLPFLREVI